MLSYFLIDFVADVTDHEDIIVDENDDEDDKHLMEVEEDVDVAALTSAFNMADFFDYFEDNIQWGGHEFDHARSVDEYVDDDTMVFN